MKRCLSCYKKLVNDEVDFHRLCSKKMFGQNVPPELPYNEGQMEELATQVIRSQLTVTGVQPKLSLDIEETEKGAPARFTIVGLWGGYILKPSSNRFPQLPEIEDLTMHLAEIAKIKTVPHSLIRLQSGELAYITKRIDRVNGAKLHMEDMCQLTEKLTEDKYRGSYEQVAKTIMKYSVNPGLDVVNYFEQVVFSFITGNSDMHLKNFSLINDPDIGYVLTPAYDMVSTTLVYPEDKEELALSINGKKKKIKKSDFSAAFYTAQLDEKQQENIFNKMRKAKDEWFNVIDISFVSQEFKRQYKELISERLSRFV